MALENDLKVDTQTEETQEIAPEKQYMTSDQANKLYTAREARLLKEFDKRMADMVAKLTAPKAVEVDDEEDADESPEEVKVKTSEKTKEGPSTAEIAAKKAMAEVKALKKQRAKEVEENEKIRQTQLAKEELMETTSALSRLGVKATKHALAVLKQDSRITRNSNGDVVFKMPRDFGGERIDEEMELEAGIREWLETEDGKLYQPPREVAGSNASGSRGVRRPGDKLSKSEAANILSNFVLKTRY